MRRVRILVVDDTFAPHIAGMLRTRFEPRWIRESIVELVVLERWERSPETDGCDIAIFDVRNAQDQDVGQYHATAYAARHPDSLVIVKTVHQTPPNFQNALSEYSNIKVAAGTWDEPLLSHVMGWLRRGGIANSLGARYLLHDCKITPEVRQRFVRASGLIDMQWFERATEPTHREQQVALLEILGDQLCQEADLARFELATAPYLRVQVEPGAAWMPWEYILFGKRMQMTTPLLYSMPSSRPAAGGRWQLGRILFVYQGTTSSWEAEYAAIQHALGAFTADDKTLVEACDIDTFLTTDVMKKTDVVHFAMHGPDSPSAPFDEGVRAQLLKSIRTAAPTLVVLNACNGIYLLLNQADQRYPINVDPMRALFRDGVDTVLTAHFLLEDGDMPPIWSRTFYLALALTGDAAVAAAWARNEVAQRMKSLCELATVVVSRQGSCLTRN